MDMIFILVNTLALPIYVICFPKFLKGIFNKKQRNLEFSLSCLYLWIILFANVYGISRILF